LNLGILANIVTRLHKLSSKRLHAPNSLMLYIAAPISRLNFIGLFAYVQVFGTEQLPVLSELTIFGTSVIQGLSV
jgi:hypothetical protein